MIAPKIEIEPCLRGPFPANFIAHPNQIAEVMRDAAGISQEQIFGSTIEFVNGTATDLCFTKFQGSEMQISMRGIYRAMQEGELTLNEIWQDVYGTEDMNSLAHYVLAGGMANMKAENETQDMATPKTIAKAVRYATISGTTLAAYSTSNANPFMTAIGFGVGVVASNVGIGLSDRMRLDPLQAPIIDRFMHDRSVAIALKGALDIDYRG